MLESYRYPHVPAMQGMGIRSEFIRLAIPLLIQEGRLRHQEKDAKATTTAQTVWLGLTKCFRMRPGEEVPFLTTINASPYRARASRPSAPFKEASRLLLDVAATPPMSGGEWQRAQE